MFKCDLSTGKDCKDLNLRRDPWILTFILKIHSRSSFGSNHHVEQDKKVNFLFLMLYSRYKIIITIKY